MSITETYEERLTRERAERAEKIAERVRRFDAIAKAAGLGEAIPEKGGDEVPYSASREYPWRDGGRVWMRSGTYETGWDKVKISGSRPYGRDYEYIRIYEGANSIPDPSATMTLSKTDEQIATELKRRVLVPFGPILDRVNESIKASDEYDDKTTHGLETLKGASLTEYEKASGTFTQYLTEDTRAVVKVYGESVRLDIHGLNVEMARKIIEVMRGV